MTGKGSEAAKKAARNRRRKQPGKTKPDRRDKRDHPGGLNGPKANRQPRTKGRKKERRQKKKTEARQKRQKCQGGRRPEKRNEKLRGAQQQGESKQEKRGKKSECRLFPRAAKQPDQTKLSSRNARPKRGWCETGFGWNVHFAHPFPSSVW